MKRTEQYLEVRHGKHLKEWDTVIAICGEEGGSKSNLALHLLEWWMEKVNGKCVPEDIKHMCLTGSDFVKDLSNSKQMDMVVFDEAGELDSRRAMSKFNVMLSQAYKVIRADKLFTVLVLPEFFDLETRFRNRRVKGLFYVFKRGRVAFWGKDKLRRLCAMNENRNIKNYFFVKPDFYDTFPIYKGVMKDTYVEMKTKKTKEARENLMSEMNKQKEDVKTKQIEIAKNLSDTGMSNNKIAVVMEVSGQTIGRWLKEIPVPV